jgi:hypothetical protein
MPENVLILGAGASRYHDFPVSREIWDKICINKSDLGTQQLEGLGFDPAAFADFSERLRLSHVTSVDLFAEYVIDDADDLYMAKGLIAYCLAIFEGPGTLAHSRPRNWYRTLSDALIGLRLDEFPRHDLAIITFNYDRSFERYLFDCLRGRFGKRHSVDEITAAFRRLPIIHIYGQLGALPELAEPGESVRPYERILTREQLDLAVAGMHLLPEIKRDPKLGNREAARKLLRSATGNVTFLGFAYDPENLLALDLANTHTGKQFYGTVLGIAAGSQMTRLNERIQGFGVGWHALQLPWEVFDAVDSMPDTILGPQRNSARAAEPQSVEPDAT